MGTTNRRSPSRRKKPGNQTPDTPEYDESKMSRDDWEAVDTGNIPGNQTPNKKKASGNR